ncbi:MAG TPA: sortase [Kribbella sp.]|uniref:sortase domain-containing protein n=1 Tax=Kribbella sp. TaxID=1871183 RepID=UPI002D79D702|nr:sortase [Kribbella sp.]HET6298775.1 sortase [Kribbella sp.]
MRKPLMIFLTVALIVCGVGLVAVAARPDSSSGLGLVEPTAPGEPDAAWPTGLKITRGTQTVLEASDKNWLALGLTDAKHATKIQPEGSIQIPPVTSPDQLGWYCLGRAAANPTASTPRSGQNCQTPVPGTPGAAVVLGHVNGGGKPGVFAALHTVKKGDSIQVERSDGRSAWFTVSRTTGPAGVSKDNFPTQAVYGATDDAELRLITCGGRLDKATHRYLDQIIVWATLDHTRTAS